MRKVRKVFPWMVALALVACGGGTGEGGDAAPAEAREEAGSDVPEPVSIATEYAPELGVDLAAMMETPTGLRYEVVEEGSGVVAEPGDHVTVHYTGWLPSGKKFDSSRDRNEPFSFPLGAGRVIAGWDEGVAGMAEGERHRLVIPPDLGYGAAGAGTVIPPDATLVFDVELLEVR